LGCAEKICVIPPLKLPEGKILRDRNPGIFQNIFIAPHGFFLSMTERPIFLKAGGGM
jgi:hypothetical protein